MNKLLKVLGAAALIAGLTPYQVSEDEAGNRKIKALLWQATTKPNEGEGGMHVDLNFGFTPKKAKEEEAGLFSDELTVNYNGAAEEVAEEVEEAVEEVAEEVEKAVEEVAEEVEKAVEEVAERVEEAGEESEEE